MPCQPLPKDPPTPTGGLIDREPPVATERPVAKEGALAWGNTAPLALAAFAVTTFMLSMINAKFINAGVKPVVFGVALMFGGLAQFVAGILQFRIGKTFGGMLFTSFGAFWMAYWAIGQFYVKEIPAAQVGHALGLFLYAFGMLAFVMLVASLRTNAIVVVALAALVVTFFLLGAGEYGAHETLAQWGGYLGLAVAATGGIPGVRGGLRGLVRPRGPSRVAAGQA